MEVRFCRLWAERVQYGVEAQVQWGTVVLVLEGGVKETVGEEVVVAEGVRVVAEEKEGEAVVWEKV